MDPMVEDLLKVDLVEEEEEAGVVEKPGVPALVQIRLPRNKL
jgi:hypothetical protein